MSEVALCIALLLAVMVGTLIGAIGLYAMANPWQCRRCLLYRAAMSHTYKRREVR